MTLDPITTKVLEVVLFFLLGAATWALALYRYLAMEKRRVNLLCFLVLIEEASVLFLGVWLANHSGYAEAAAIAVGGAIASRWIMKRTKAIDDRSTD